MNTPRIAPFITIEGVDGAGKSSHIPTVVQALERAGFEVVKTNEPGGTPLGERLRLELKQTPCDSLTEVLMAFASRSEHLAAVIRPALAAGVAVVSDRFTDSTYAYQGGGGGYPVARIAELEKLVHGDLSPDLTLFFDLPSKVAERRRGGRRVETGDESPDKFDDQDIAYFGRARDAYLERVAADPTRFATIDASLTISEVAQQVRAAMDAFVSRWSPSARKAPRP